MFGETVSNKNIYCLNSRKFNILICIGDTERFTLRYFSHSFEHRIMYVEIISCKSTDVDLLIYLYWKKEQNNPALRNISSR